MYYKTLYKISVSVSNGACAICLAGKNMAALTANGHTHRSPSTPTHPHTPAEDRQRPFPLNK